MPIWQAVFLALDQLAGYRRPDSHLDLVARSGVVSFRWLSWDDLAFRGLLRGSIYGGKSLDQVLGAFGSIMVRMCWIPGAEISAPGIPDLGISWVFLILSADLARR